MIDVQVKLNGRQIGMLDISRIPGGAERPDSVNTYEVGLSINDLDWHRNRHDDDGLAIRDPHMACVTFKHRYGDGWPVLLQKALAALAELGAI